MLNILSPLVAPVVVLSIAYYLQTQLASLPASQLQIIIVVPLVLAIVTLLLSLKFNRSRLFFVVLTLVLSYALMKWEVSTLLAVNDKLIWWGLSLLLPACYMVFSSIKERGIFTWHGSLRFGIIGLPALLYLAVLAWQPDLLTGVMALQLWDESIVLMPKLPQINIIVFIITLLLLNGYLFIKPGPQSAAMFISFIAALMMLMHRDDIETAAIFASASITILLIAVVMESWSMAYLDQLTGLPGRRALDESMLKLGNEYSFAMLDIDHFKKFNDRHGHDAGDQVLKMVASKIKKVSGGGRAYRYGGEEFSIIFPGKQIAEVTPHLEALRETIAKSRFQLRKIDRRQSRNKRVKKNNVKVTLSIGVATRKEKQLNTEEVVKAADKALYKAKNREEIAPSTNYLINNDVAIWNICERCLTFIYNYQSV